MSKNIQQSKPVVVVGFGGHGRVCAAALQASGRKILAATDLTQKIDSSLMFPILTDEQAITRYSPQEVEIVLGLGSTLPTSKESPRPHIVKRFSQKGYRFTGFCHPTAWISADCSLAESAQIHAGVIIQPGCSIGEHTILNTRCSIDHDSNVGDFCHIAPGATTSGNVTLGEGCHIGTGANIVHDIELRERCFVAAGATVVRSACEGTHLRGTPARQFVLRGLKH